MKALLDTCTFLWMISDPEKLSPTVLNILRDPENDIYLSSVSTWEIAIQEGLGRIKVVGEASHWLPQAREQHHILSLPLSEEATLHLARLPNIHRDPFDRMLVCQSLVHAMPLLTPDAKIAKYPLKVIWNL